MIGKEIAPARFGKLVAWTFGLAPALLFVLTWAEDFATWQQMLRIFGLPVLAAELVIILASFSEGIRLHFPRVGIILIVAWTLIAWLTAVTAPHAAIAVTRTAAWMVHLLFGLALVNLHHHGMLNLAEHLKAQYVGFILFFVLLVTFVATTDQTPTERIGALPAFTNVRWFAYYASGVIGIAAVGFLTGKFLPLIAGTAAFSLIFWTGARGAVAATFAGLVVATIFSSELRSGKVWARFFLSGLAGVILSFVLAMIVPMDGLGPDYLARTGDSGRIKLWLGTIESFKSRPLFGWGEGQLIHYTIPHFGSAYPQPHNVVLQALHAWGVIGSLLCFIMMAWLAPSFIRSQSPAAIAFRCGALMIAAYSLIDGSLFYTQSVALFTLCCAAAVTAGLQEPDASIRTT